MLRPARIRIDAAARPWRSAARSATTAGVSDANSPNLAGQYAAVTYKE